jgi:predicted nucleic acid-binding protein
MRYLLDTNVLSERLRQRPDPAVVGWLDAPERRHCVVSTVTFGEIQKGVLKLEPGRRRSLLERWLDEVPLQFGERVLPVDTPVARAWGGIAHHSRRTGREIGVADGLLLATAVVHELVVVTRNVRHFQDRGVLVLDPWMG